MLFKARNYNVVSKHPYYQYLGKYNPYFIARDQTDQNFILGRKLNIFDTYIRGNYRTLVKYYAGNHMTIEEHHSLNYKSPWWLVSTSYTAAWYLTAYIIVICLFYLGDPGRVSS